MLYENGFDTQSDLDEWSGIYSSSGMGLSDDHIYSGASSLKKRAYTSYDSPSINLYSRIKAMGAGTYHFALRVLCSELEVPEMYMMLRGKASEDENSFIKKDPYSKNYFARISSRYHKFFGGWGTITGSVKVLKSDIEKDTGNFIFCLDGIPEKENVYIYFDDLKIVKLSENGVTNSDFSDGLTGWVSWQDNSSVGKFVDLENDGNIFGYYMRARTYSSIACNVDQIISYYGGGRYDVSFNMRVSSFLDDSGKTSIDWPNHTFTFYLTSGFSKYHKWIGQADIAPDDGKVRLNFTVNADLSELNPDEEQVHFRIQCPDDVVVEYTIDNFTFMPKKIDEAYIKVKASKSDGTISEVNSVIDIHEISSVYFNVVTSPMNTPNRLTYTTSDPTIATVDADGYITLKKSGVVTLTGTSRTGNVSYTKTLSITGNSINGFTGYGQEAAHQCWAACGRMLAQNYAKRIGISIDVSNPLATDIVANGYALGDDRFYYDTLNLCEYYLGKSNMPKYCFVNKDISDSLLSESQIISLIDNGCPIEMMGVKSTNKGHAVVVYGYYYKGDIMHLRIYDPNMNSRTGGETDISYNAFKTTGYNEFVAVECLYLVY